ncbi:MAG: response regulator [Planctomycetota bacterium]
MTHPANPRQSVVSGLRISGAEQDQILSDLDNEQHGKMPGTDRRASVRKPLPPQLVINIVAHHPGGSQLKFHVRARNLNDHGIALLHGGFLHLNSVCIVEIFDGSMPLLKIPSTVVRCRYLRHSIHEIGLKFDQAINADDVLKCKKQEAPKPVQAKIKIPRLTGRVLYVDPIETDRRYLGYRLAQLGLNFRNALSTQDAIEMATANHFDLIITEYRLRPDPATFLVRRLRNGGLSMPIIVLGNDLSRAATTEIRKEGATACLAKPFDFEKLIKLLAAHLPEAEPGQAPSGLVSQHWEDHGFRPLIIEYVNDLTNTLDYLSETIMQTATEADALNNAKQLAATAGLYGYPPITEAAHELSTLLSFDPLPTDMIYEQLTNLQTLAKSAQSALD